MKKMTLNDCLIYCSGEYLREELLPEHLDADCDDPVALKYIEENVTDFYGMQYDNEEIAEMISDSGHALFSMLKRRGLAE